MAVAVAQTSPIPERVLHEGWNEAFTLVAGRIRAIDAEEERARALQGRESRVGDSPAPSAQDLYLDGDFVAAVATLVALLSHAAEMTMLSAPELDNVKTDPAAGGRLAYAAEGLHLDGGCIEGYGDALMRVASQLLGGLELAGMRGQE